MATSLVARPHITKVSTIRHTKSLKIVNYPELSNTAAPFHYVFIYTEHAFR